MRVAWFFGRIAFRLTPRPFFAIRRTLLRMFGAKIGKSVHVYASAHIYMPWNLRVGDLSAIGENVLIYNLGQVSIGGRATVSYRAHLCAGTHDFEDPALKLVKPAIVIGDEVWIGTDSFIGPGVAVGRGAIVGARAVVVDDVPALAIVAGNPAKVLRRRAPPNSQP